MGSLPNSFLQTTPHTHLLTEMLKLLLCALVLLTILDCTQSGHIRDGRYDNYENLIDTTALIKSVQDTSGLVRVKRESCDQEGATNCITTATQTYMDPMFEIDGENAVVKTVPEGEKPDYYERKTCNFILEAEKCFDKLESCGIPADQFNQINDNSMKAAKDAAAKFPNWDENKCKSNSEENNSAGFNASIIMILVMAGFVSTV